MTGSIVRGAALALVAAWAGPALAQNSIALDHYSLPPGSAQAAPTPKATPSPAPTVVPLPAPTVAPPPVVATIPTPLATPTPTPAPKRRPPRLTPSASPSPLPSATPTPQPSATPAPSPSATETPLPPIPVSITPPAAAGGGVPLWPWIAAAAAFAVLLALAWLRLRRRRNADDVADDQPVAPLTPAPPAPLPPPPLRPWLDIAPQPRRAGLNLLSATVESELVVRNTGDAPATGIAIEATLVGARSAEDATLGALFARGEVRPAVPPFALAPGEERRLRVLSVLPRDALEPLTAGGRPMFVPVLAIDARYRWDDGADAGQGQTAAAHAVGIVRGDGGKLAPFWLDVPPRMHDTLATRPHSAAIRR